MYSLFKLWALATILVLGIHQGTAQLAWTKDSHNPVLVGNSGQWNAHIAHPCVLFNTDSSRYEMWFIGYTGLPGTGDYHPYNIGFAFSTDGIHWSMYPSPVLTPTPGTWDAYTVDAPMVIRQNGQYKMWYTSFLSQTSPDYMGYATSPDGIHWTKYPGNPVLGPGKAAWEVGGPYGCFVMPFEGGYKMWYPGLDATFLKDNIGYATSPDGITWHRDTVNNPVLKIGTVGQWDDSFVANPHVLSIGSTYYMWYTGLRSQTGPRAAGVATSNDSGRTWTKYAGNPVLAPSEAGWDGTWLEPGSVLQRGDTLDMWYFADSSPFPSNRWSIGHATSKLVGSAVDGGTGNVPAGYVLEQNYPNPFNPTTRIQYALPHRSHVSLTVYNTLGQKVATLVNGDIDAGHHSVLFDGSGLASGIFFYRLQAGSFVETKMLSLIR